MKKMNSILVAVAIMVSSFTFAAKENPTNTKAELHKQIVSILGTTTSSFEDQNIEAEVSFTLNSESEIVILSVKSDNASVESYVKNKLNYQKVNVKALNEGKIYKMPLKIVNS